MAHDETMKGNQIYFHVRKGSRWPPLVFDLRAGYDETLGSLRARAAEHLGVPTPQLQLWRHKAELSTSEDARTLADMDMHTGFVLHCFDLTEEPSYWPPVKRGADGLLVVDDAVDEGDGA